MTRTTPALPDDITVLERGWLSANNVLFQGAHGSALVDSGYFTHADQTVDLVAASLDDKSLDLLLKPPPGLRGTGEGARCIGRLWARGRQLRPREKPAKNH